MIPEDTVYEGVTLGLDTQDLEFLGRVKPFNPPDSVQTMRAQRTFLDMFREAGVPLRDVVEEMK